MVLQLLERGQPPESIRIVDFRPPTRADLLRGPAAKVDFVQTDISSAESTAKAFDKPWHPSVARLPLTVFHTAAVIVPSDRYRFVSDVCDAVNVGGTQNVVDAARRAGADVLVSTTSASISIRPVELWLPPWRMWSRGWPRHFWQVLDEKDFLAPLREHEAFFGNYPASKAAAERIVCGANSKGLRTGCIRPANGIYGSPTDNTVGGALSKAVLPT
jgi:nucleoside-diphosphate-sugar epimerase